MRPLILALIMSFTLVAMIGCGGSGSSSTAPAQDQGRLKVTIKWPKRDRTIPQATNSITITAVELVPDEEGEGFTEDQELNVKIVPRPEGDDAISVTVLDLPAIKVRIRAKAFENGLGTGQVIAAGSTDVQVQGAGSTSNANITLTVAVAQITVEPPALIMNPGQTSALVATPRDADGNAMVLVGDKFTWSSTNTSVATVAERAEPDSDSADVSAVAGGSSTVRVTHLPTGVFADVPVSVMGLVTVSPAQVTVPAGGTQQFTAVATGTPGATFTWTVSGEGSISNTGLFTAGSTSGSFTVTATVVGQPTRKGTAAVTVGLPFLFAGSYSGTTNTLGFIEDAAVFFSFDNGEVEGTLGRASGSRTFPVDEMDNDSFTGVRDEGAFTVSVTGIVNVSGNTATLTMVQTRIEKANGNVVVTTFTGQRQLSL